MVRNGRQRHDGRWWNTYDVLESLALYYGIDVHRFPRTWKIRAFVAHYWCQHPDYVWYESWPVAIKRNRVLLFEETGELPYDIMRLMCPLIRAAELARRIGGKAV